MSLEREKRNRRIIPRKVVMTKTIMNKQRVVNNVFHSVFSHFWLREPTTYYDGEIRTAKGKIPYTTTRLHYEYILS